MSTIRLSGITLIDYKRPFALHLQKIDISVSLEYCCFISHVQWPTSPYLSLQVSQHFRRFYYGTCWEFRNDLVIELSSIILPLCLHGR